MKFRGLLFVLVIAAAFSACRKDDLPPAVLPATQMVVFNVSGDIFNIFQNGNRLNTDASLYPNGTTGYMSVTAGVQNYQLKKMGSPDVLVNMPLTLDTLKSYSFFVTGLSAEETFLLNDDLVLDTGDVATVRFVNASPETSNMDLVLRNIIDEDDETGAVSDTTAITNIAFKSASASTAAAGGNVELKVFKTGTLNALVTDTVSLQTRQGYTIFVKGRLDQTGDRALGTGLFLHQ